jgi:hypothetical protein
LALAFVGAGCSGESGGTATSFDAATSANSNGDTPGAASFGTETAADSEGTGGTGETGVSSTDATDATDTTDATSETGAVDGPCDPPELPFAPTDARSCDEAAPGVRVVSPGEDLGAVLEDTDYDTFCLQPGTHGDFTTSRSGTADRPIVLRAIDLTTAPWQQDQSDRANVDGHVTFAGAAHWEIHGVTFAPADIQLDPASNLVFDQVLVEGTKINTLDDPDVYNQMVLWNGSHNTIQNSVFRNSAKVPYYDQPCIDITDADHTTVVGNEIYDCAGDGVILNHYDGAPPEWEAIGTKIIGNEIYQTSGMYVPCDQPDQSPDAMCSCGENAIDIKNSNPFVEVQLGPEDRTVVAFNVMYGFRRTNTNCGGTGDAGSTLAIHMKSRNVLVEGNVLMDSAWGIMMTYNESVPKGRFHTVRNNLFYDISQYYYRPYSNALVLMGADASEFYHNTIVGPGGGVGDGPRWLVNNSDSADIDMRNNLLVEAGRHSDDPDPLAGQSAVVGNAFVAMNNGYRLGDGPEDIELSFDLAGLEPHCFTIRHKTAPQEICVPNARPSSASPLLDVAPSPGATAGRGVDDEVEVEHDLRGRLRTDGADIGAFEYIAECE